MAGRRDNRTVPRGLNIGSVVPNRRYPAHIELSFLAESSHPQGANEHTMSKTPLTAIILAHGPALLNGVQLSACSKLLLPVANRPLVEYQGAILASAGVELVIVVAGDESDRVIRDVRNSLSKFPFESKIIPQEKPRGTAGSIKQAEDLIRGGSFWVLSSDLLLDADLGKMAEFHFECASKATAGACSVDESPWEMERIELDPGGLIKNVHRMHPAYSRRSRLRPVGIYLFETSVLDDIPKDGYYDIKEQLFPLLHSRSRASRVWEIRDYCQNIASFDRYIAANWDVLLNRAPFHALRRWDGAAPSTSSANCPRASAFMIPPVSISLDSRIEEGAVVVGPTCIAGGCTVEKGAVLNASVLLGGSTVGNGARVTNCVVSEGVVIKAGAEFRDTVVLPDSWSERGSVIFPAIGNGSSFRAEHVAVKAPMVSKQVYRSLKRAFDVLVSACVLLLSIPAMLLISIAIKLDSPGPVLFRQRRCGQKGVEFTMYKFRSMVSNAEDVKREIQFLNQVDGPMFKMAEDPRTTRVGRFLRATNLDEFPQFWNVLKGDLAMVGPRPLSWDEMYLNPRWRDLRISVPQGIVGLWQMYSHANTSFADWIRYDTEYVYNRSFWLDQKIIFLCAQKGLLDLLRALTSLFDRKEAKSQPS